MSTITLLTPVEVASALRISRALAYKLIARGQIGAIRFGRTVRVRQEDLDLFIERNAAAGSALNPITNEQISS